MAKKPQPKPAAQLGKAERALIAGALPWTLGVMPAQVRLSAREQQNRPAPFVPKGKRGKRNA